jgi:hypothetical protein
MIGHVGKCDHRVDGATHQQAAKKSGFDVVVKERGFSRAVSITKSAPALQAAEKPLN